MLIVHVILAAVAVGALARWPTSGRAALAVAGVGAMAAALGAPVGPALAVTAPLVVFLCAALTLARLVERSGLAERAASALATAAGGNTLRLYVLVCALCAALTAAVSLDGAVVLMVPLLLVLVRRSSAPAAPLFLGVVAVANTVSIAVPQGNPTNLVLMDRLGISATAFLEHMFVPGVVAAISCAAAVAVGERRALVSRYEPPGSQRTPLSRDERHAACALVAAALTAFAAPAVGLAPWWPFSAVVGVALAVPGRRPQLVVPWRLGAQVAGLLIALDALGSPAMPHALGGLGALLAAVLVVGAASAVANNLPVSAWATTVLAGPSAYAAAIGLSIGALATPHGSVATLIATELAGPAAPPFPRRRFAALAAGSAIIATVLLWALP